MKPQKEAINKLTSSVPFVERRVIKTEKYGCNTRINNPKRYDICRKANGAFMTIKAKNAAETCRKFPE